MILHKIRACMGNKMEKSGIDFSHDEMDFTGIYCVRETKLKSRVCMGLC